MGGAASEAASTRYKVRATLDHTETIKVQSEAVHLIRP